MSHRDARAADRPDESDPAEPAEMEPLMLASRAITAAVVHSLLAVSPEISVVQLRVLSMVDARGPLSVGGIASGLGVNPSNASRTCDRLVRAGLLSRRTAQTDRRQVELVVTADGAALVDQVMRRRRAELSSAVTLMSPEDRRRLMSALDAFNAAVDASPLGRLTEGCTDEHLLAWTT